MAVNGYAQITFPVPMPTTSYTITVSERLTSGWGNSVIVYGYDYANSSTTRATITARQVNTGSITLPVSAAFAWQLMGHL